MASGEMPHKEKSAAPIRRFPRKPSIFITQQYYWSLRNHRITEVLSLCSLLCLSSLCCYHRQGRHEPIFYFFDSKSIDHDTLNVPVRMLDEEGICGIGNEQQGHVRLCFSLYQGARLPVLKGGSYRRCAEQRHSTSKLRANHRSPIT
jgi:hypothetical protein